LETLLALLSARWILRKLRHKRRDTTKPRSTVEIPSSPDKEHAAILELLGPAKARLRRAVRRSSDDLDEIPKEGWIAETNSATFIQVFDEVSNCNCGEGFTTYVEVWDEDEGDYTYEGSGHAHRRLAKAILCARCRVWTKREDVDAERICALCKS